MNAQKSLEVLSQVYTIDQKYKSMTGPVSTQPVVLLADEPRQLVWITGYEAVMVGPDGKSRMPQEFMCHSNLDFNVVNHRDLFVQNPSVNPRLFTLSQGQFKVNFPEGFGIPVWSNEPLSLTTQVLNHNLEHPNLQVRHKVTIKYIRDRDVSDPMKPLFPSSAYSLALLEGTDGYFGVEHPNDTQHGASCLPAVNASTNQYSDKFGKQFTGHWVVKPGREVNRTLASKIMNLPYDTTVHYVAVHLHPFAESLELRDLTTGKTVFHSRARNFKGKIGLDHVDYYSSAKGIPMYKDHDYEIVSQYNNTSGRDQDSMAVMYLYFLEKNFRKPTV